MRRITSLLFAAGAVVGIGSIGSATSADAGRWCPPAVYPLVYYGPHVCCSASTYGYYWKTTQYWPVVRKVRSHRILLYRPIKSKRR